MPGFYSKRAKNSGKRIPPGFSTWQDESIGVPYVAIASVSREEFGQQVKKDSLLLVYRLSILKYSNAQKKLLVACVALHHPMAGKLMRLEQTQTPAMKRPTFLLVILAG